MKRFLLVMSVGAILTFTVRAVPASMEFSYCNGETIEYYGYNKNETYDVAIRIADPSVFGAQITGFTVPLPVTQECASDFLGWMTAELRLEDKKNVADIEMKEAELANGMLSVTFNKPYTIPAEGVYVGYSFTITDRNGESTGLDGEGSPKAPIATVANENPNGFYLHASKSHLKWASMSSTKGCSSAMTVNLSTDFGDYDAVISIPEDSYIAVNETGTIPAIVVNHGSSPLVYLDYSYSAGSVNRTNRYELTEPIATFGESAIVNLPVGPFSELAIYDMTVTIDTCNGEINNDSFKSSVGTLHVLPFIPTTRPLVEEFTGLGCGYCPRGYVAMEEMNEQLGDMFIGMAFHTQSYESGCMVTVTDANFPIKVDGFPSGDIDRQQAMDPSYLPYLWPSYQERIAPADINVEINWADEDYTEFVIESTVKFVENHSDANYSLAIALVADNVYNERWGQSNYFSGDKGYPDTALWNLFTQGASKVFGLKFNDVVAYFKDIKGIPGSIPAEITRNEGIKYSYRIKKEDIKNIRNEYFLNDDATVHAVAILIDGSTGFSANCNKSSDLVFGSSAAIDTIDCESAVESVHYYDLQGRDVAAPADGIFVKTEKLSDGTVRYSKVIICK
ncbi:MAG: hypothetical protein K2H60_05130 [Muribaculaceae bacterium]|nr:hypothetical protein [Muribaculaceae bacterium]